MDHKRQKTVKKPLQMCFRYSSFIAKKWGKTFEKTQNKKCIFFQVQNFQNFFLKHGLLLALKSPSPLLNFIEEASCPIYGIIL